MQDNNTSSTYDTNIYACALFRADDIAQLVKIAGVSVPIRLETLIDNTVLLQAIFENETAVKFMTLQCTGDFMVSVIANSAALELLRQSPYYTLVQANEHWAKFLSMVV